MERNIVHGKYESKLSDEYYWKFYPQEYQKQISDMLTIDKQDFFITDWDDNNGKLVFKDNLHNNWKAMYDVIYRLKPASIGEVGCGGCYHLYNINKVLPEAEIYGFDLLAEQIEFGKKFCDLPESICKNISVIDFTTDVNIKPKDLIMSHACLMHMSSSNCINALYNMKKVSSKYVLMVEGLANHDNFEGMVADVFSDWRLEKPSKYVDNCFLLTKKIV